MPSYPLLEIAVIIGSQSFVGEALPDTGFDGDVIIPLSVGEEVLKGSEEVVLQVADGFDILVEARGGELLLADRSFEVAVRALGDEYLIGRGVLDQLEICFEFGRSVRVRFE